MKKNILGLSLFLLLSAIGSISCEDKWDDHYTVKPMNSTEVIIYEGQAQDYINGNKEISKMASLLNEFKILDQIGSKNQMFTILLYNDEVMASISELSDTTYFINTCISDMAIAPARLSNGLSILMWNGKYLEITTRESTKASETAMYISGSRIIETVQTNNAFIYILDQPIYAPLSLYETLCNLGDNYSRFRNWVKTYEKKVFDEFKSTPIGIDETGNTIYDSVFLTKNTYFTRYTANDHKTESWNMYSEAYSSTMLIPSNEILEEALSKAFSDVREILGDEPTIDDSLRIQEWVLGAFFYNKRLTPEELTSTTDIKGIADYKEDGSSTTASIWRPSIQQVDVLNPIILSNGLAYKITKLKIPNNIVTWRIKSRFYQVYESCDSAQLADNFNFINLDEKIMIGSAIKGGIGGWDDKTPYFDYKALRAEPTAYIKEQAQNEYIPTGLEFVGMTYNPQKGISKVAKVPAGEYYLRMGFYAKSFSYRYNIYINDKLVAENFDPNGGHLDRYGGAYYPYGYEPKVYSVYDKNSDKYDKDGVDVATITIGEGADDPNLYPFTIKIIDTTGNLAKGSIFWIYHWCLRPTENNY